MELKKVLAFDLDDTLAITKSPIDDRMRDVLSKILDNFDVCVISGGRIEQFKLQITDRLLNLNEKQLSHLHLMPTCGTRYYKYDLGTKGWALQYAEDLTSEQKTRIRSVLEESTRSLGFWPDNPTGEVIEDRDSQLTFSALGQQATPESKYAWDPDGSKKLAIVKKVGPLLPDLEVRAGGTTSIDVTRIGIDKAYGIQKLMDALRIEKKDILFFGDKLNEGGNDFPVKAFGVDSIEVTYWTDTVSRLDTILAVTNQLF
jgi:phosphomannomutase